MSMMELSDNEMDKLFRKSAEEPDIPYDPADWDRLSKKLDEAEGRLSGTSRSRGWVAWTILLLMLGSVVGYLVWTGEETREVTYREDSGKTTNRTPKPSVVPKNEKQNVRSEAGSVLASSGVSAIQEASPSEVGRPSGRAPAPSSASIRKKDRAVVFVENISTPPRRGTGASGGRAVSLSRVAIPESGGVFIPKFDGRSSSPEKKEEGIISPLSVALHEQREPSKPLSPLVQTTLSHSNLPSMPWESRLAERLVAETEQDTDTNDVLPDRPSIKSTSSRWAIRLGGAPDLSTVAMKHFSTPGPAAALLIEYSITSRLFVQMGLMRSLKTYRAMAGDYEWPSYWQQAIKPNSVDGDCRVLEVPLNFRYVFREATRSSWYVSAGLSSYKMQNEEYWYNYTWNDPSIRWWHWEGQTGWYWMSHANLALGYERSLSPSLSLGIEPYLRAPLRRVGYGKVNLTSMGTWISLRYKLPRAKR